MNHVSNNIARRARLSTGAIIVAVLLTIAALLALAAAIGRPQMEGYEIQNPVSPLQIQSANSEAAQ